MGESLVFQRDLTVFFFICFASGAALEAYLIKMHEGVVGKAEYVNEVGGIFTNLFVVGSL